MDEEKLHVDRMSENRVYTTGWDDYELVDAGGSLKLERWGSIYTIRPEVQAYFKSENWETNIKKFKRRSKVCIQ